jgi:hypothetical protein
MIIIKFSDDIKHEYHLFEDVSKLENYDEITYLYCSFNKLKP